MNLPVFANTATVPTREWIVLKGGARRSLGLRVRVGLLVHPVHGPILIDAGYGPQVTTDPGRSLVLRAYASILRPQLHDDQSPLALLARHGLEPGDVRHIILTHLHADHTSYLGALPHAAIHLHGAAWQSLQAHSRFGNMRHGVFDELLPDDFEARIVDITQAPSREHPVLGPVYDMFDGAVSAVPLLGHAPGHIGVLFGDDLLYATDTQWLLTALSEDRAPGLPASATAVDPKAAAKSADLVRAFQAAGGTVILCHDPAQTAYDL